MEIKFKRDTSFRKQFFVPDSFAHPAKMDAQLLIWIVEHYTNQGETILDPMAGSGTSMLACGLGRNVVLVELEEKFCKMMRDNWEEVRMRPQLGSKMGNCQIIQGDARQLEGLVDKIVTSPPYAKAVTGKDGIDWTKGEAKRRGGVDGKSNVYLNGFNYGDNPNNIGNLPYGEIDKCIFSPPFAGNKGGLRSAESFAYGDDKELGKRMMGGIKGGTGESPDNIDALPYGQIDKIVTSPPYEGSEARDRSAEDWWNEERELEKAGGSAKIAKGYQAAEGNIGNLKSQSYLEAMLQVYQQCYKVLKEKGLMILVTKNFIRNKQVIRLDTDTIKLCEQAGFSYLERYYRRLPSQSFWRVIYHKKHPEVEQILNEDVLVFSK